MEQFGFYFAIGCEHILRMAALDHILFTACLAITFLPKQYKQLLILLTAFTIGHSITLALNVLSVVEVNEYWVEILIPITIIIMAILNISYNGKQERTLYISYLLALFFGLIHGLAYASSLRFMLAGNETIALPLLAFNIGIEVGQIIVSAVVLSMSYLSMKAGDRIHKYWIYSVCITAIVVSLYMLFQRF